MNNKLIGTENNIVFYEDENNNTKIEVKFINLFDLKSALKSDCWVFILYEWKICTIESVAKAIVVPAVIPPIAKEISVKTAMTTASLVIFKIALRLNK